MINLEQIKAVIDITSIKKGVSSQQAFSDVSNDSRQVSTSTVFIATRGTLVDGHDYLPQVCEVVSLIIVENEEAVPQTFKGTIITVSCSKRALAHLAKEFYSPQINNLSFYGVTGTNGKTSTTYILESLLKQLKHTVAVLGTNNHRLGDRIWQSQLTTPGPLVLHKRLHDMQVLGAQSILMEVSSHALHQQRVGALKYDVAIFTNLTRDHLDYHKNFAEYFAAKASLFKLHLKKSGYAIINGDDKYGQKLLPQEGQAYYFGTESKNDFVFKITQQTFTGSTLQLNFKNKNYCIESPFIGMHNAYNLVAGIVALYSQGYGLNELIAVTSQMALIPGRLESVSNSQGYHIFVDYAHTDDALKNVLSVLSEVKSNAEASTKLYVVFGCGGDRDVSKRPLMLKEAQALADVCIVTSDNPRTEDPYKIIADILREQKESSSLMVEVDRKYAIKKALNLCQPGDVLLIAGKGHEDYQIIGTEKKYFSDQAVVKEVLNGC